MPNDATYETAKQKMIDANEQTYGAEARAKYGDGAVDRSTAKIKGMSPEQQAELTRLTEEFHAALKAAFEQGDPAGELATRACNLHERWLSFFWADYTKEAHIGVSQMYVDDPRFTEYYDKVATGCAPFLRDAVRIYCGASAIPGIR